MAYVCCLRDGQIPSWNHLAALGRRDLLLLVQAGSHDRKMEEGKFPRRKVGIMQGLTPKFVNPTEVQRLSRRAARRSVKGRGALANATGVGFSPDMSTTEAVLKRMVAIGAWVP